eukprot:4590299-Pleurochrysis_carterae.AAC.2
MSAFQLRQFCVNWRAKPTQVDLALCTTECLATLDCFLGPFRGWTGRSVPGKASKYLEIRFHAAVPAPPRCV